MRIKFPEIIKIDGNLFTIEADQACWWELKIATNDEDYDLNLLAQSCSCLEHWLHYKCNHLTAIKTCITKQNEDIKLKLAPSSGRNL